MVGTYGKDLYFEKIKLQLKDLFLRHKKITDSTIKKVTSIQTLCEIFNSNQVVKKICPEVHELLMMYITVPVTMTTAERAFLVDEKNKNAPSFKYVTTKVKPYNTF